MIIFRGAGILAVLFFGFAIGGGYGIAQALGMFSRGRDILQGVLLIGAAVATWFIGKHLNITKADVKLEQIMAARAQEVHALGRAGAFTDQQGNPLPPQDAYHAAEGLIAKEREEYQGVLRNQHSLFWIPMQYLAPVMGVLSLFLIGKGLFT